MIKSFRRPKRLSSNSDSIKHQISRVPSGANFNESVLNVPKIVIKALYDYQPQGPDELSFQKGDFFHVMNVVDENEQDGWYEATNPMTNAKGMVPMTYFEKIDRTRPKTNDQVGYIPNGSKFSSPKKSSVSSVSSGSSHRNSSPTLYAIVLYEFKSEREDELAISPGESLIICAHHEYEWFIAKPINRTGGPGLVPVTYVKIVDLINPNNTLNHNDEKDLIKIINTLKIPTVEQWKAQTARYQASSRPVEPVDGDLHTFDRQRVSGPIGPGQVQQYKHYDENGEYSLSNRSSLSSSNISILEASVDSYHLDANKYQYLIVARLSNGKMRYLYRYYDDFYQLQVSLLELFPYEAGKIENSKRTIPSIPGPLFTVNDNISRLRREKLDRYIRELIQLPSHISRCEEVLRLFEILDNGYDREIEDNSKERQLKPISQKSIYQQDRLSQYSNLHNQVNDRHSSTPISSDSNLNRLSASSGNLLNNIETSQQTSTSSQPAQTTQSQYNHASNVISNNEQQKPPTTKVKVKFYYQDDIFVLLLPVGLKLNDLKTKLFKRLSLNEASKEFNPDLIKIYLKNDLDNYQNDNNVQDYAFNDNQLLSLKTFEINDDDRFQNVLYDKCKLCILA